MLKTSEKTNMTFTAMLVITENLILIQLFQTDTKSNFKLGKKF